MEENKIKYTYYTKTEEEEHMLLPNEIAKIFKIVTRTGKSADRFVSAYIQHKVKELKDYTQKYFLTRYGMAKVYPAEIYIPIMVDLVNLIGKHEVSIEVDSKKYNIKIEQS